MVQAFWRKITDADLSSMGFRGRTPWSLNPMDKVATGPEPDQTLDLVWSDMGTTHLLIVCQAPDESVKNVVGQRPQREVSDNGLHHPRVSLKRPCLSASSASFLWMFCLKNDNNSVSSRVIKRCAAAAIFFRKEHPKPQGVT